MVIKGGIYMLTEKLCNITISVLKPKMIICTKYNKVTIFSIDFLQVQKLKFINIKVKKENWKQFCDVSNSMTF